MTKEIALKSEEWEITFLLIKIYLFYSIVLLRKHNVNTK